MMTGHSLIPSHYSEIVNTMTSVLVRGDLSSLKLMDTPPVIINFMSPTQPSQQQLLHVFMLVMINSKKEVGVNGRSRSSTDQDPDCIATTIGYYITDD